MRSFMLVAMLFASMPAVAEPARGIEGGHERFGPDEKALRTKIYGESSGIGFTFCSAFIRAFTLGVSTIIVRQLGGRDFPVFDEAREINPRAAAAGTILGGIVLACLVSLPLAQTLSRRRARRARRAALCRRNLIPTVKQQPDAPDDPDGIVGYFVTRDGYEFVVTRDSRQVDDSFN